MAGRRRFRFTQTSFLSFVICRLLQKLDLFKSAITAEVSSLINLLIHSLFPLLTMPFEFNYRACTIPYRFPSNNPRKPTPTELSWIDLFYNSTPSFKKRAESDASVPDAPARAEKFAQRYTLY
ncbi:hypothetical protein ACFX2A_021959 [Malus domestica]